MIILCVTRSCASPKNSEKFFPSCHENAFSISISHLCRALRNAVLEHSIFSLSSRSQRYRIYWDGRRADRVTNERLWPQKSFTVNVCTCNAAIVPYLWRPSPRPPVGYVAEKKCWPPLVIVDIQYSALPLNNTTLRRKRNKTSPW